MSSSTHNLPPRPTSARGAAHLVPGTSSSHVSPRIIKHTLAAKKGAANESAGANELPTTSSPCSTSPRRPMSASRVQPTSASLSRSLSPPPTSPKGCLRTRPASARRAHVSPQYQLDTLSSPTKAISVSLEDYEDTQVRSTGAKPSQLAASTSRSPRSCAISDLCTRIHREQQNPAAPMDPVEKAKLRAFLESWQDDEPSFRSAILFSESTFAQAKAMVSDWSAPNAFLSAIAYGCLEQFGLFMEKDYPFLREIITELGASMYSNFADLLNHQQCLHERRHEAEGQRHQQNPTQPFESRNRFLHYFQHGKHWFQDLAELKRDCETYKFTAASSQIEIQRLNDKLLSQELSKTHENTHQSQPCGSSAAKSSTARAQCDYDYICNTAPMTRMRFPQLRNLLYGGPDDSGETVVARLDIHASDYDFWPCCEEILLVFQSLPRNESLKILSALIEKAAELKLPGLGEMYAVGVDLLDERERRQFLREYFLLVSSAELQDALQERDECNDEKRWQVFIDELKVRLGVEVAGDEAGDIDTADLPFRALGTTRSSQLNAKLKHSATAKKLAKFHSDEAKVGSKVLEMVELLEDLAVEASFLDESQSGFSSDLLKRLREYDDATKRVAKARELMMQSSLSKGRPQQTYPSSDEQKEWKECACHCGNHQLVHKDDLGAQLEKPVEDVVDDFEQPVEDNEDGFEKNTVTKARRRSSAIKRPFSGRRKNAVNFGARLSSHRGSTPQLRLFPLSEVCHMLSAILHLKFSRDSTEGALVSISSSRDRARRGSADMTLSMMEDRWSFLRNSSKEPTFKSLAKDYLTRKYGIKSIAVMHTLQLERSLVYFSAMDKHVRCELFAWFFGANKMRLASKDYAFQFFQRLVKSIMTSFLSKRSASSSNAGLSSNFVSQQQQQQYQLTFAALISVWAEFIGDGETSTNNTNNNAALVRYLLPSQAIDACNLSFPVRMKEANEYTSFLATLHRLGLERGQVEMEAFLKNVMEVWLAIFDRFVLEIHASLGNGMSDFDFDAFTDAVARSGMELTGGERLEIFDLLSQENDESVVSRTKLLGFFLEAKHLRASS